MLNSLFEHDTIVISELSADDAVCVYRVFAVVVIICEL
jgi:hypothetical protein